MRYLYTILFYLAIPFIMLRLLWRARKAPDYAKRLRERLGFFDAPKNKGGIWIHAVSLGESIAAEPLIKQLIERYPSQLMTVTTTTPTGSARIKKTFGERVFHVYFPYDIPCGIKRFLTRIQPKLAIMIETELWPNVFHICKQHRIPVIIANARLSERSAQGYGRFASLTRELLNNIRLIAVQNQADAERFIQLGAPQENVKVLGSVKFDLTISDELRQQGKQLRANILGAERLVWIAASTHAGEDEQVLQAFADIKKKQAKALLLLVPRHPERFDAVAEHCQQQGFNVTRRGDDKACNAQTDVFLGDTMGEMLLFYGASDIAFVGGSLIERGGHNPLEPAALEVPVICGPHVFNFAVIADLLKDANALITVTDAKQLATAVLQLAEDKEARNQMTHQATQVVAQNSGALKRHLDLINKLYLEA